MKHVPLSLPQHEEAGEKRGKAKEQEGSGDLPLEVTSRDQPEQRAAKKRTWVAGLTGFSLNPTSPLST